MFQDGALAARRLGVVGCGLSRHPSFFASSDNAFEPQLREWGGRMDFSQIADIADVLAALGVIASLVFVAYEIRKNTNEAARTKWETTIDRLLSMWGRTSGEASPAIIHKGRQDFQALSEPERIVFQNYHIELLVAFEAVFVIGAEQVHGEEILDVCRRHLRHHLGFSGTRDWWSQFSSAQGLSPLMTTEVEGVIGDGV